MLKKRMIYRLDKGGMFFPLFFMLSLMFSCTDNVVFHSYTSTPEKWNIGDTVTVSLQDSLSPGIYSFDIETRNTAVYPYRDLWLLMDRTSEINGMEIMRSDTLHLILADEKGRWTNSKTIGAHSQATHPMGKITIKNSEYRCRFHFRHVMNDTVLNGITDIGVCLRR